MVKSVLEKGPDEVSSSGVSGGRCSEYMSVNSRIGSGSE